MLHEIKKKQHVQLSEIIISIHNACTNRRFEIIHFAELIESKKCLFINLNEYYSHDSIHKNLYNQYSPQNKFWETYHEHVKMHQLSDISL